MDLGSLLLGLALLLIVVFVVARPMLLGSDPRDRSAADRQADQLIFDRERVLAQLRDLDFDQATGKLAEDDYAAQRANLVAQGVAVLKQLDARGLEAAPANGASPSTEDEIEAAIAALRQRAPRSFGPATTAPAQPPRRAASSSVSTAAIVCPNCGRPARPGDQFCGGCGQRLPVAENPS
jgi:hypothetical protein